MDTSLLETFACFLTYCIILKDYGYRPINLPFLGFQAGIEPAAQDYFNPYDTEFKGNSRAFMREYKDLLGLYGESREAYVNSKKRIPAWASDSDIHIALRLFFPGAPNSFWGDCYWDSRGQNYDDYVCYRIEAVRHSQGAFLLSVEHRIRNKADQSGALYDNISFSCDSFLLGRIDEVDDSTFEKARWKSWILPPVLFLLTLLDRLGEPLSLFLNFICIRIVTTLSLTV